MFTSPVVLRLLIRSARLAHTHTHAHIHIRRHAPGVPAEDLVHNGHVLHAIRGLWPTIMSASVAAACVLGLLEETSVLSKVMTGLMASESSGGSRFSAFLGGSPCRWGWEGRPNEEKHDSVPLKS